MTRWDLNEKHSYKRSLMGEFMVLWGGNAFNFSSIRQLDNERIEVYLCQYPEQNHTEKVTIFHELKRLRHFGWQLSSITFDEDQDLHLIFEKVDWRSRQMYGLIETKHNNLKDLWWFSNESIEELRKKFPLESIVDPNEMVKARPVKLKKRKR